MDKFSAIRPVCVIFALLMVVAMAVGQTAPPRVLFTDLESGPNTGGENNAGVFVTIYGSGFGASRGSSSVTVGGGQVAAYRVWTDSKITVQIGPNAKTGNIVVTTGAGSSNGLPFTVRSGGIYFVSTGGNDSNNGSFSSPWRTMRKCVQTISAGDTCYVMNGVTATQDEYNSALLLGTPGADGRPKAIVVYPGHSATIGGSSPRGVYACSGLSSCPDGSYWVVAGFNIRGVEAVDVSGIKRVRIVGNNIQCPNGDGASACVASGHSDGVKILGNEITNAGNSNPSKLYHSVYMSSSANNVEIGWNWIHNNRACRGVQFHSTGAPNQYGLLVHDNLIHDIRCDGINFATIDPSKGKVEAYNNVIFNAGTGPDFPEGPANYSCIYVPAFTNSGSAGSGTVEVYNNTLYNCGGGDSNYGGAINFTPSDPVSLRLRNNIVVQTNGRPYLARNTSTSRLSGSNNLWFGNGSGPSQTTANVNADPMFVNVSARDFHLKSGSPAIDAGVVTTAVMDRDGVPRAQGKSFDIGAYEYFTGGGSTPPPSPCDVNRSGSVESGDVAAAKDQALGVVPCGSGDLDGNGACNVIDVQRVINAVVTGTCRAGQ